MDSFYHFEHLSAEKSLIHAVTQKKGLEPFEFSLALHTGEETNKIISNRDKLSKMLSLPNDAVFITANQTHSNNIAVIESKEMRGWHSMDDAVKDCDAMITNLENVILTILTADCVPILLYDRKKRVVAAVHAGWRGTESGIVAKTVEQMKEKFSSDPGDIIAGVAPAIGKCCYEVGEDVAEHFGKYDKYLDTKGEKYMLDLPGINREQMLEAGLKKENIEMSGICTACENSEYFSYRAEKGCSGRFMSMIGLVPA